MLESWTWDVLFKVSGFASRSSGGLLVLQLVCCFGVLRCCYCIGRLRLVCG